MELQTSIEIIDTLRISDLILKSVNYFSPSRDGSYSFLGNFVNGSSFNLFIHNKEECKLLIEALKLKLHAQYSLTSQFKDFLQLKVGEKYTLAMMGDMGFVFSRQFIFHSLEFGKYAQYTDSVKLIFKEKRKCNLAAITFYERKSFAIWAGFVEPNTDIYGGAKEEGGLIIQESKYLSCDSQYFTDALKSVDQKPFILYSGY